MAKGEKSDEQKSSSLDREAQITTKEVLRYHWRQAKKFPKFAAVGLIVAPITIVLERYITPLIIAALLFNIQAGDISLGSSWWMIIAYGAVHILAHVVGYRIVMHASWGLQIAGMRNIYKESYESLTRQSLDFYNNNFAGSLVSRVNKLATAFASFWWMIIYDFLFIVTTIIATLVGIGLIMWPYAIALFVFIVLFTIASYLGTRFLRPRQKARSQSYNNISAQLSDSFSNMFAVKIDSRERYERSRLNSSLDDMIEKEKSVRHGILTVDFFHSMIVSLIHVSILFASVAMIEQGVASAATAYLALTYTFNLLAELKNITRTMRSIYQITGDSEIMLETLAEPMAIVDKSSRRLKITNGEINIEDLAFTHHDSNTQLFSNFNLTIRAGEKVGIVGVSGSGKTTLTKLLMRFIDPSKGKITIDGTDIASISQASLHDAIAYVPQEPLLFHRSIGENISYGKPEASDEDIRIAAQKARADKFTESLADGYDTVVGERGVKLSGGQRQRIAIARAILKDAPILILDEATSALDSESEKLIQKSLDTLMEGRTSVVIAHRLSTIAKLDRIIVLDDGKIVEDGTHAELLKKKGTYAKLWNHQSGGFIEE